MNKIVIIFFLLTSLNSYSQTKYYTTDGENRMTKSEVEKKLYELENKMQKTLDKRVHGSLKIKKVIIKEDSIISQVSFKISDKKRDELFSTNIYKLKGERLPEFNLKTLNGSNLGSEILIGKPTLINFWFTGCKPCIDEMPALNKIVEKYQKSFNFIAITYENKEEVKNFLKEHPFEFKHLIEAKHFIDQLGITTYPVNLFLNKSGTLKYVKAGIPYEIENRVLKVGDGNEVIKILEKLK